MTGWFRVWGIVRGRQHSIVLKSDDASMAIAEVIVQYAQDEVEFTVHGVKELSPLECEKLEIPFDITKS